METLLHYILSNHFCQMHTYTHTAPFMPEEVKKQFHPVYCKLHFRDVLSPHKGTTALYTLQTFLSNVHTHTHTSPL